MLDIVHQIVRVLKSGLCPVFKVDDDDVVSRDAFLQKMVFEERLQQIGLAAAADAGDYFDGTETSGAD